MKSFSSSLLLLLILLSCTGPQKARLRDDGKIEVNFVQINDVYEIAPLSGGREGGVARVATIKKKYLQQNPNTFLVIAGDFLSPSVYNSLQFEGKPVRGRQMVEALNAAKTDLACFGNHEFDIRENELLDRINESRFQWIASNSFHRRNNQAVPFQSNGVPIPETFIMTVRDADGTTARIGFLGICLPFNRADYVSYTDPLATAKELYGRLKDSVDAVVAITHQAMQDDELLAKELPGLAAIIGGHEHDQRFQKIGNIYITKAMANAKSAYVVKLKINKKRKKIRVEPILEVLDERVALDDTVTAVVKKWTDIAEKNFAALGFNAGKVVLNEGEPLDGRETVIRSQSTNLSRLIAAAMMDAVPKAEVVLMNAGSVRVDDILHMPVTEYDIIRTLPFGGGIREVDMKGDLLLKVLEQGKRNVTTGGFLVYNDALHFDSQGRWLIHNSPVDPEKVYHVALAEFLLTGKEANLDFLNPDNPGIVKVYPAEKYPDSRSDIRLALIRYLEKR